MKDEKNIHSSEKKIDKIFEKMKHKGISISGRKINDNTYDVIYPERIKKLFKEARNKFGISKISDLNEKMLFEIVLQKVEHYHSGKTSESWNINSTLSAVKSFNLGVQETNVFKNDKKFSLGNTDKVRRILKSNNVRRLSKTSTILRATSDDCEKALYNIKNQGYKTRNREIAYHICQICYLTGARVSAALNLKAGDINIVGNKITFFRDKGGLTRTIEVSEDTSKYLGQLKSILKDHQNLFIYKRKNGTKKSVKEARKDIERLVRQAGEELTKKEKVKVKDSYGKTKYVEVTKNFTVHSFRKAFALERTYEYLEKFNNPKVMDQYIQKRIKEDPNLKEKIYKLEKRINETRKTYRPINIKELAIFFTSVDLGHFRNDVLTQYYTTYEEVCKFFQNKK